MALRTRVSPRLVATVSGLVVLVAIAVGVLLVRGIPPREVALATGPAGSAYSAIGERYKAILARSGVSLKLVPTAGDADNLAKLGDPRSGVSAAFVISGLPGAREATGLASLGTIAYEPLWLFERANAPTLADGGADGKRISLDLPGSGTQALATRIFQRTGLHADGAHVVRLAPAEAADRLVRGDLDAMAVVADWDSPVVRRLVADPRVSVFSYRRADALVALNPDLRKLTLPAGIGDFAANLPPADVTLVAPTASLVVRGELHDALQYLLLDAASKVHAEPGIFHPAGAFPAPESMEFPLSDEAARYYKSGRPFLQRHLPFWAAVIVERLLFVLVPLVGVLIPVASGLGGLYRSFMEQRILALYGELRLVEGDLEAAGPRADYRELLKRIDDLDHRANRLRVPVQFAQMLYTLKDHVQVVRGRLSRNVSPD